MAFAKDTIKLGTARRIFSNSDIAAHDKQGDRIADGDIETKVASYSAVIPEGLRIVDTGLTDLCIRIVGLMESDRTQEK